MTRISPVSTEQFICNGEIFLRIVRSTHAARRFETNGFFYAHIADHFHHDARAFRRRIHSHFTGRGFDEVSTRFDGDFRRFTDQRFVFQFAGFNNHFQQYVRRSASLFTGFHQVKTNLLVTRHQRAVREHHVNFIGTVGDCRTGFCQRDFDVVVTVWEVSYRSDTDFRGALLFQSFASNRDKARIDTDSGGIADRSFGLMTQGDHFLIGVVVIQGGQVHQFQCTQAACFQISHFILLACRQ